MLISRYISLHHVSTTPNTAFPTHTEYVLITKPQLTYGYNSSSAVFHILFWGMFVIFVISRLKRQTVKMFTGAKKREIFKHNTCVDILLWCTFWPGCMLCNNTTCTVVDIDECTHFLFIIYHIVNINTWAYICARHRL